MTVTGPPPGATIDSMDRPLTLDVDYVHGRAEFTFWREGYDKYPAFRFMADEGACAALERAACAARQALRGTR